MFLRHRFRHRQQQFPILPKHTQQWVVKGHLISPNLPNKQQQLVLNSSSNTIHNHPATPHSLTSRTPTVCQTPPPLPPTKVLFCISLSICIHHPTVDPPSNINNNQRNRLLGIHTPVATLPPTMVNNPMLLLLLHLLLNTNRASTSWRKQPRPSSITKTRASSKRPSATLPVRPRPLTISWTISRR